VTVTHAPSDAAAANLDLVRRFFACFAEGNLDELRTRLLTPDVLWEVPGRHPLAGTLRGPGEVITFFAELGRCGFRTEPLFLQADADRVVEVHRGWSARGDGTDIDLLWVLVVEITGGRIVRAQSLVSDQAAADTFFWNAYRLAPLPARLAGVGGRETS